MNTVLLRTWSLSLALVCGLALASCNGDSASPMAPSSGAGAGATIQGLVNPSGSTSGAASFGATAAGSGSLTVMVVGTDLVAEVGANGQFMITNVPPGSVQLHFTGAGTNAILDVGTVASNQTLQIVVRVGGSSAALEGEESDDSPSESVDSVSDDNSDDDDSADADDDDDSTDDDSVDDDSDDDESDDDESDDDESDDDESDDDESNDDESNDDESNDDESNDDESNDDESDDDDSEDDDAEDDS